MFERILVALDGSSEAEQVLSCLPLLCSGASCRLTVARIVEPPPPGSGPEAEEALLKEAQLYLSRLKAIPPTLELTLIAETRARSVAESLLSLAREQQVSLLALSVQGEYRLEESSLGQVVKDLILASPIPLFLFNSLGTAGSPPSSRRPENGHGGRMLMVVDPRDANNRSASQMAEALGLEVVLLQILPTASTGREEAELRSAAEDRLGRLSRDFEDRGIDTEGVVEQGDAAMLIQDAASRWGVEMIAMTGTATGAGGLDPVVEAVLLRATVPVLLSSLSRAAGRLKDAG